MAAVGNPATPSPPDAVDPALRRLVFTLIVGALAVIFDTTIMSVAIDSLAGQLHTTLATVQWVTTAYLLALSATMPAVGLLDPIKQIAATCRRRNNQRSPSHRLLPACSYLPPCNSRLGLQALPMR